MGLRQVVTFLAVGLSVSLVAATEDRPGAWRMVTMVQSPPTGGAPGLYAGRRAPLGPAPLLKLPIGSIHPQGWLRHQLECLRDGQAGRLPEISRWCRPDGNAWMSPDGQGAHGWEELPYWLRGLTELAYVLGDETLIARARPWIDALLASQEADGWFGPRQNRRQRDLWPNMLAVNVLQCFHEATGDARVLPFMARYLRWQAALPDEELLPGSWQKIRAGDNLESILWLYDRTGEKWLLDLARRIHERTARWDRGIASWHGVNICQGFREPAVYCVLAGDRALLDAAERNYQTVMALYGQVPGGMFGADENCRPGHHGPRQGAETCSMVEFMHSFEMLLGITGDPVHADRCEEVAFNDLPASMTPDLRALHYLTAPNMVRLDRGNKAPAVENEGCMLAYDPHLYRCCQHNAWIGWPQLAGHLWMATRDRGLAAVLYAPCQVNARVGEGAGVHIAETTDYPFDENIQLTLSIPRPTTFPLYLRVPQWCQAASVAVNGEVVVQSARPLTWVRVERSWQAGDRVLLQLPMEVALTRWRSNANAVSVRRGPLWYSLKIGERWVRNGGTDEWPAYEVFPATPWNYALLLDPSAGPGAFGVVRRSGLLAGQPFAVEGSPIELTARGRRLPEWKLDANGLIGRLPPSPVHADEPTEEITLVPMGCARLRVSAFPTIDAAAVAQE